MGLSAGDFGTAVFFLIVDLLLAIIPARIANGKGYSFAGFYVFGVFMWLVALIVALVVKPKDNDPSQALLNYKQLLDAGVITREEFDRKKSELLK